MADESRQRVGSPESEARLPFYRETRGEMAPCRAAMEQKIPLLLKGPTGCGKTRLIERLAAETDRPLVIVACNEDTTAADLVGRYLLKGGETEWQDGPATRAARSGALLYLDELAEAREDVLVVLHALADHRRELYLDRRGETLVAAERFFLAASFNPGYQARSRELKPSTRQRFITVSCGFPGIEIEAEIIATEAQAQPSVALALARLGAAIRAATDLPLRETVSTRSLVYAAKLAKSGLSLRAAAAAAVAETLTDEPDLTAALRDLINLKL